MFMQEAVFACRSAYRPGCGRRSAGLRGAGLFCAGRETSTNPGRNGAPGLLRSGAGTGNHNTRYRTLERARRFHHGGPDGRWLRRDHGLIRSAQLTNASTRAAKAATNPQNRNSCQKLRSAMRPSLPRPSVAVRERAGRLWPFKMVQRGGARLPQPVNHAGRTRINCNRRCRGQRCGARRPAPRSKRRVRDRPQPGAGRRG